MSTLLKLDIARPYHFKNQGKLPSFDKYPGPGVLLFSALDTTQELMIAMHLESLEVPTAIVPLPLCPEVVSIELGNKTTLRIYDISVPTERIAAIWCLTEIERPKPSEINPEEHEFILNEWRSILATLRAHLHPAWMNAHNPGVLMRLQVLDLASKLGFLIPRSIVTNDPDSALNFLKEVESPCVVKRVGHDFPTQPDGTTFPVYTRRVAEIEFSTPDSLRVPVLLQEEISKTYEYRVYVIGNEVISFRILAEGVIDWRSNLDYGKFVIEHVVLDKHVDNRIKSLTNFLGLNYAAVDLIQNTAGNLYFLEVNPNGNYEFCDHLIEPSISERIALHISSYI